MSAVWYLPLGVGVAGVIAIGIAVKKLDDSIERLKQSMRPLRVSSSKTSRDR